MDSKHVLCYCSQYQKLISNIEENSTSLQLSGIYFCFITLSTIGFGDFVPVRYSIALFLLTLHFLSIAKLQSRNKEVKPLMVDLPEEYKELVSGPENVDRGHDVHGGDHGRKGNGHVEGRGGERGRTKWC